MSETPKRMTAVFEFDLRRYHGNPHRAETPFGRPETLMIGDACEESDLTLARIEALEAERDALRQAIAHAMTELAQSAQDMHAIRAERILTRAYGTARAALSEGRE
jgi:hypothetical protein